MEENNIFEGTIEESAIASEVTSEEPFSASSNEFMESIETNESTDVSDLVGKVLFAAITAAIGCGVACYLKKKPQIQVKKAEKMKKRAEAKVAKAEAKIAKANVIITQYQNQEISEDCEAITVTTTE